MEVTGELEETRNLNSTLRAENEEILAELNDLTDKFTQTLADNNTLTHKLKQQSLAEESFALQLQAERKKLEEKHMVYI